MKSTAVKVGVQILLIAVLLAGAGLIFKKLKDSRPTARKEAPKVTAPLVDVTPVAEGDGLVTVEGQGTVVPTRRVVLQPEVNGRVIAQHPQLVIGGRVAEGETLLELDRRDYEIGVNQQWAAIKRAEMEVKLEEGRQAVAARDWRQMGGEGSGVSDRSKALALRQPQLENLKTQLAAAWKAWEKSKIAVERTTLTAPFNGVVVDKRAEIGSVVGPGSQVVTLVDTDRFNVEVSVPVENLAWLAIPGVNAKPGEGSAATVHQDLGGAANLRRSGRVTRLLSEVDPRGRMARVVVTVENPYEPGVGDGPPLPLLLGSYVRVRMEGTAIEGAARVARSAIRDGDQVWVAAPDDTLDIRTVRVAWRATDHVLVDKGLSPGDRIITGRLPRVVQGMALRVAEKDLTRGKDDKEAKAREPSGPADADEPTAVVRATEGSP